MRRMVHFTTTDPQTYNETLRAIHDKEEDILRTFFGIPKANRGRNYFHDLNKARRELRDLRLKLLKLGQELPWDEKTVYELPDPVDVPKDMPDTIELVETRNAELVDLARFVERVRGYYIQTKEWFPWFKNRKSAEKYRLAAEKLSKAIQSQIQHLSGHRAKLMLAKRLGSRDLNELLNNPSDEALLQAAHDVLGHAELGNELSPALVKKLRALINRRLYQTISKNKLVEPSPSDPLIAPHYGAWLKKDRMVDPMRAIRSLIHVPHTEDHIRHWWCISCGHAIVQSKQPIPCKRCVRLGVIAHSSFNEPPRPPITQDQWIQFLHDHCREDVVVDGMELSLVRNYREVFPLDSVTLDTFSTDSRLIRLSTRTRHGIRPARHALVELESPNYVREWIQYCK